MAGTSSSAYRPIEAFTLPCPKVTFPEVTTCIHESNPRTVPFMMRYGLTNKGFISEPVDP